MTINFYLDTRGRESEKSIRLFVRTENKTFKYSIGEKIEPKLWDVNKQLVRRSYTGHPELNSYLNTLKEKIQRRLRLISLENDFLTNDMIKHEIENILTIKNPIDSKKIFWESLKQFIESRNIEKRFRTVQKYQTLLTHLQDFEKAKHYQITFERIDLEFYERFTAYLIKDLKHTNNTIGKYISCLKTFLSWAAEKNHNTKNDFKKFKVLNEKSDITYLTENELMKIYTHDFSDNKSLAKVRDVFCFQCFTGQRFSDIENLKREDIKNDTWILHTYKTKDIIEIPLSSFAKDILNRYKTDSKPLPVISHQKTNDFIKDVCRLAEINEPVTLVKYSGAERIETTKPKYELVTTHTARRTFVTLSLEKGMRPETVKEVTGHKSYKTLQKYIKITSKVKHDEMNKFWKKPSHLKVINFN